MAEPSSAQAEGATAAAATKKPKGRLRRMLLPLVLLVAGGVAGAAAALLAPQYLAFPAGPSRDRPPVPEVAPLQYVEIDNSFTANLKDSGRFVQVRIAVSTQGGKPVVDAVERHRIALIAAVLAVLSDTGEADLEVAGGRDALAKRMRLAINDVLQRKSGIAGVEDVFLTSFVLQ